MNIIELIRAQRSGVVEPVIPGESISLKPGDRIRCEPPFTEVSSIIKIGNDLSLVLSGLTPVELKHFFNSTPESVISFHDQEFRASQLSALLTIRLGFTDTEGVNSQLELLPGSLVNAHSGQLFTINAETVAIKDLHRDGYDLILNSHDDNAKIIAVLQGFFIAPEEGQKYPELQITDPAKGTAFDKMIHPHDPIFQWQGEPLPQAVVGAMYAYYFHLDAEDADKMILTAKTTEGELPAWLTFANLGQGSYLLSGLPNSEAVGTIPISIIAHSTSGGVGVHTQQAFDLMVQSSNDVAQRSAIDDVAAAEFRKAGESIMADSYGGGILSIDQMPYMTMPEIASIVGLAAVGQIAIRQPFSTYTTPQEIASEKNEENPVTVSQGSVLQQSEIFSTSLDTRSLQGQTEKVQNLIKPNNAEIVTETGGLSETNSEPVRGNEVAPPTQEVIVSEPTPVVPEVTIFSIAPPTTQTLLPFLNPPMPFPEFHGIVDLPVYMDGIHGFKISTVANFQSQNATIVQDGDGFGNLLVAQYNNLSPYSRATYIPGSTAFPANSPFTNPSLNMTSFNNDIFFSPVNAPGSSVVSVSDFNGDGVLDYLIAPVGGGPAFIVSGSSSALPSSVALSSLGYGPYTNNFATKVRGDNFSSSGALGDADGDGFGDVILGNPGDGQAYVIFSNAEVFADFNVSYITLFSNYGIHINGLGIANNAFNNVTGVNFNGDEYNDIFVGFTDNISNIGSIGVILGGTTLHGITVSITSSGVSGASGFLIVNSAAVATDYLAMPTNIGNFTGSGFDDIAIASKDTVYVIFGNTSFTAGSTFDVNTLNGSNGFTLTSSQPGADITNMSYVGDVNGDGNPDFAFVDSGAFSGSGAIYVIFGSRAPFSPNIDYTTLDQNQGFVIKDASGILANATVGGGGDLNGDGLGDIVITAGGNVFTVFGSNFSNTITDMGTQGADDITVTAGENVIYGLAGNDNITGGDNPDYIDGGTGADTINAGASSDFVVYDSADISVNGGSGTDVLWFKYDHTHADLRGTLVFSGFEVINLTPLITLTGNSIMLNAATVTAMSDENTITIYGNGHDKVTIMAADNWTQSTGSPGFTTYTAHSGAFINVQDGIDVFIQPRMLADFIDGVQGFALDGPPVYFYTLGWGVALVQDINGDGFGELLTGNRTFYSLAKADIIFGQSDVPAAHIQVTDPGVMGTQFFSGAGFLGGFVAGINDFNGDGYKDIFIPAKFGYHSYIVYGDPSGFPPSLNLPSLGTAGLDIGTSATGVGNYFATGAALGDLNGDGLGDVGVANGRSGNVFVVFGNTTPPTSLDVTTLDGTNGFRIFTPGAAGNSDSAALAGVDINGDGFTDIFSKTTSSIANQTYISVILGHSTPFAPTVDTSTLVPGTGFHFFNSAYNFGYNALGRFGIANLGDINGSGIDAVGIHGSLAFSNSSNIGNAGAYIVFGDPAFSGSGNFDLTTLNGTNGFGLIAPTQNFSYITSISGVGDFNGDGIADFAFIDSQSFGTGALFVIFGSTDPMPGLIDYLHLSPSEGVAFQFSGVYGGFSVGGGADFNGDGLSDIVLGAPFVNVGETATGAAYVLFGGDFSNSITHLGSSTADNITGTTGNDNIVAAQGNDIINALAGNDLINGGSGADIIDAGADDDRIIYDANDSFVNGGTGNDTLWFKDDGTRANLVGTAVFVGIDIIDLHALQTLTGNEVSLDAATVAAMTDANVLTVNGDAHGILHLVATDNWVTSAGAPGYTTYTSLSGSVINVDNDIRVMFDAPASPLTLSFTVAQLTDGDRGFDLTPIIHRPIPPQYAATSATIVQDGDGFDNILVANGFVAGDPPFARAFLIDGQSLFSSPIPFNDPSLTLTTFNNDSFASPIAAYGQLVASVGDFNGDGLNDIVISEFFGGNAHLVLGGYTSPVVLSTSSIEILGNETNSVTAVGDVNGDGLADFMLSNSNTGFGAVIFGDATPGSTINMMTLTGTDGFQIARPNPAFTPGVHDITGANFVGDSANDVFVSYYDNAIQTGGIAVILGSSPVFSSTVTITSSGISGANGFLISNSAGIPGSDNYLINPTNIGSFSGSSFDDIALSSKNTVYVIFGDAVYGSASSFDVATQLNGTTGFALTTTGPSNITSIAYLSDVNGDGLSDFAVMDKAANGGLGVIHVIFGSSDPMPASIDMSNLRSNQGFDITDPFGFPSNDTVGGLLGYASVSGGGDLNGDGLADILITSGSHEYVVFGGNFNGAITQLGSVGADNLYGTVADDNIVGAQGNDTINALAGNDFINGGTGADIINGGAGNDRIIYDANDISVNGGIGTDTLWFKDDHTLADLRGTTIFKDMDVIDLKALKSLTGNQVELDPSTVNSMSDANTLTIDGGGLDSVVLHNGVTDIWSSSSILAGYTTYTSSLTNAIVNVSDTIHTVTVI